MKVYHLTTIIVIVVVLLLKTTFAFHLLQKLSNGHTDFFKSWFNNKNEELDSDFTTEINENDSNMLIHADPVFEEYYYENSGLENYTHIFKS